MPNRVNNRWVAGLRELLLGAITLTALLSTPVLGQSRDSTYLNDMPTGSEPVQLPALPTNAPDCRSDVVPCAFETFESSANAGLASPWFGLAQPAPSVPQMESPGWSPPPTGAQPCVNENCQPESDPWCWQILPQGIIYQSYMAGTKEPRFATYFNQNSAMGSMWDAALGARVGLWRYGNADPNWPEGWQLDIEGGVFPRLDPFGKSTPLIGDDFRFGIPLTYGGDKWEFKTGYYHISAHLGDEYLLYVNPLAQRINYVRDSFVFGAGYFFTPALRLYGEVGVASTDGGAKPVELQFGCEWAQARDTGFRGGPFAAVNADLRQEVDYGGNITVQFGWMWRRYARGPNFRIGGEYFYGKSDEYEFFNQTESRIGWGLWYDF